MKLFTKILFSTLVLAGINQAFADTQDRHLSGFHAISSSSLFDLYITQGSSEAVKVEASPSDINHVITEVRGDVLTIHDKSGHFNWGGLFGSNRKMRVYITVKDINSISISGSGDVYFKESLNAGKLSLRSSGSGDILGKLNVRSLETGMSGSGDVKLSGTATTSAISITGSGDIHYTGSAKVSSSTSGSGDITRS